MKEETRRRPVIIYPLAAALFPVLFFFEKNAWLYSWKSLGTTLLVVGGAALALWGALYAVTRKPEKSALAVSVLMLLFFSYGPLFDGINHLTSSYLNVFLRVRHMWLLELLFAAAALFAIIKLKRPAELTKTANVIAVVMLLPSFLGIGAFAWRERQAKAGIAEGSPGTVVEESAAQKRLPDVYYIILDGYAHKKTLADAYALDNSAFYGFLREKDFFLAEKSIANYSHTINSLASSLNMKYLDDVSRSYGKKMKNTGPLAARIENNEVTKFLKGKGYAFITFNSGFKPTAHNRFADAELSGGVFKSMFSEDNFLPALLVQMSAMRHLQQYGGIPEAANANLISFVFDKLAALPEFDLPAQTGRRPIYVFAHIEAPHEPYVFDENCAQEKKPFTYISNLKCVNTKVMRAVGEILRKSAEPPVIILQSDHGWSPDWPPLPVAATEENLDKLAPELIQERMRNFIAVYAPESQKKKSFYAAMSPVNIFRIIFDDYFGADFEHLPDKSFLVPDAAYMLDVIEVTGRVRF